VILGERSRVTDVLAAEGDQVKTGQVLARAIRPLPEPTSAASSAASAKPSVSTIMLKAPAAGVVTQSTASVGAVPSPVGGPLFRIMIDNENRRTKHASAEA
jgi:multidrug resistance efflux pump